MTVCCFVCAFVNNNFGYFTAINPLNQYSWFTSTSLFTLQAMDWFLT